MNKSIRVESYNPAVHAGINPEYPGSHVITSPLPLSAINFSPAHDGIVEYTGPRDASSCPKIGQLSAEPANPPIHGASQKQHLTVLCKERRDAAVGTTAYPVCAIKLRSKNLSITRLQPEQLTDPAIKQELACPFGYLGGLVTSAGARVQVAVDAENPAAPQLVRLK